MRLGVDIGGTFTDLCLWRDDGALLTGKVLTTPDDPARGVLEGVAALLARLDAAPGTDALRVVHGTTLVTNALVERKGARTALLTTRGFRDVLEIRREGRYDLYDLALTFPEPLVPRSLRIEVTERIDERGNVVTPIDLDALDAALAGVDADSFAVVFLHAYADPSHEEAVGERVAARFPGKPVSLSGHVAPEIREYERTTTTVANAYVRPVAERYLRRLRDELAAVSAAALPGREPPDLLVMQSDGGMLDPDTAAAFPIRIVESGPAGGVIAAARLGAALDLGAVLSFDMGGTTAKIAFLDGSGPRVENGFEVDRRHAFKAGSGLPVRVPSLDLVEIGAGGGSLARVDDLGILRVGPESAGADPGPAAYARGGTGATVTDADLVLGLLDPDHFLGGTMPLDLLAAKTALERHVGGPLGLADQEAARAVFDTVSGSMAEAARVHAAERGVDLERHALVAFGGAGPVHAWSVARRLGIRRLVFPGHAGVASAVGFLAAPPAFSVMRSATGRLDDLDPAAMRDTLASLGKEAADTVQRSGTGGIQVTYAADLRYRGQGFEVRVPLGDTIPEPARVHEAFLARYRELYGRTVDDVPIEIVTWRARAERPASTPDALQPADIPVARDATPHGRRTAWLPDLDAPGEVPVYRRDSLQPGDRLTGPALVEEDQSTLVLGRGTARVLTHGTLVAEPEALA